LTWSKHQVSPKPLAKAQAIQERCLVLDAHVDIVIPSTSTGMFGADGESLTTPDRLHPGGIGVAVMCVAAG
jgi:membrane dipeptidase